MLPATCSVVGTNTNSCSASLQATCPVTVGQFTGTETIIVVADTDPSGDKVTGSEQVQVAYDGTQGLCNASWDFVATRLHQ
ncbi:MAG: hypothetical protein JOZ69_09440 [Myxococcales bacterium]|nr:hypothetical protein [Myxococcales bacterium]